jgi:hypothetical protein
MGEYVTIQPLLVGAVPADRVVIRDTCQQPSEWPRAVIRADYEQADLGAVLDFVVRCYGLPAVPWGGEVA